MRIRKYKHLLIVLVGLMSVINPIVGQVDNDERHVQAALRKVGHEILLASGDLISRVLPVEKNFDHYKLQFSSQFSFDPSKISFVVDSIVRETGIAENYIVEMEECGTGNIVHSYEKKATTSLAEIPCSGRVQPMGCYNLLFTILEPAEQTNTLQPAKLQSDNSQQASGYNYWILGIFALLLAIPLYLFVAKKKSHVLNHQSNPDNHRDTNHNSSPDSNRDNNQKSPDLIKIGAYRYDKRNMVLSLNNNTVELTGKESELLLLLHTSVNTTIERETILNSVWGDEGDYIGRTLDVFISKLRKKLEADSNLRIINIRGVGYKLIVNEG